MTDHFKIPEHGTAITINGRNPRVKECYNRIFELHDEATVMLMMLLTANEIGMYKLPYKKCLQDMALQFKDLGSTIDELLEMK